MRPVPPPPPATFRRGEVQHGIELAPLAAWLGTLRGDAHLLKLDDMLQRFRTPTSYHRLDVRVASSSSLPPSPTLDREIDPATLARWNRERGSPIILDAEESGSGSGEKEGANGDNANKAGGEANGAQRTDAPLPADSDANPTPNGAATTAAHPTKAAAPVAGPSSAPGSSQPGPSQGPRTTVTTFAATHSVSMSRGGSNASAAKTLFAFSQGMNHLSPETATANTPDTLSQAMSAPTSEHSPLAAMSVPMGIDDPLPVIDGTQGDPDADQDVPDLTAMDFGGLFTLEDIRAVAQAAAEDQARRERENAIYMDPGAPPPGDNLAPPSPRAERAEAERERSPSPFVPEYAPPPGGTGRIVRELRIDIRSLDPSTLFYLEQWRREELNLPPHELRAPLSKWYAPLPPEPKPKEKKAPKEKQTPKDKEQATVPGSEAQPVGETVENGAAGETTANGGATSAAPDPDAAPEVTLVPSRSPSPDIILRDGFDGDKADDPDFRPRESKRGRGRPRGVGRGRGRGRERGTPSASARATAEAEGPVEAGPSVEATSTTNAHPQGEAGQSTQPEEPIRPLTPPRGRPRGRPRSIPGLVAAQARASLPNLASPGPAESPAPGSAPPTARRRGGPRGRPRGIGRGGRILPHHPHYAALQASGINTPEVVDLVTPPIGVITPPPGSASAPATAPAGPSTSGLIDPDLLERLLNSRYPPTPPRPAAPAPSAAPVSAPAKLDKGKRRASSPAAPEPKRPRGGSIGVLDSESPLASSPPQIIKRPSARRGPGPSQPREHSTSPIRPTPVHEPMDLDDSRVSSPILAPPPQDSGSEYEFAPEPETPSSASAPSSPPPPAAVLRSIGGELFDIAPHTPENRMYVEMPPLRISRDDYRMRLHVEPEVPPERVKVWVEAESDGEIQEIQEVQEVQEIHAPSASAKRKRPSAVEVPQPSPRTRQHQQPAARRSSRRHEPSSDNEIQELAAMPPPRVPRRSRQAPSSDVEIQEIPPPAPPKTRAQQLKQATPAPAPRSTPRRSASRLSERTERSEETRDEVDAMLAVRRSAARKYNSMGSVPRRPLAGPAAGPSTPRRNRKETAAVPATAPVRRTRNTDTPRATPAPARATSERKGRRATLATSATPATPATLTPGDTPAPAKGKGKGRAKTKEATPERARPPKEPTPQAEPAPEPVADSDDEWAMLRDF